MYYDLEKSGERLKKLRKEAGCTQERMAEETGLNIKTIQAAEQGKRGVSVDTLCVAADYFGASLDYIVAGETAEDEWAKLTKNLSEFRKRQLLDIAANMIATLGWGGEK